MRVNIPRLDGVLDRSLSTVIDLGFTGFTSSSISAQLVEDAVLDHGDAYLDLGLLGFAEELVEGVVYFFFGGRLGEAESVTPDCGIAAMVPPFVSGSARNVCCPPSSGSG